MMPVETIIQNLGDIKIAARATQSMVIVAEMESCTSQIQYDSVMVNPMSLLVLLSGFRNRSTGKANY